LSGVKGPKRLRQYSKEMKSQLKPDLEEFERTINAVCKRLELYGKLESKNEAVEGFQRL
jgi:hypothetical protein